MASYGINFRSTSGYVTDGSGETYSLGEAYPTTRGGLTFGWGTDMTGNSRNRSTGVDRRFAGLIFRANSAGGEATFRIDLTATGAWRVRIAAGDASNGQRQYIRIKDNTTTVATVSAVSTNNAEFADASGVVRTAAAWAADNVAIEHTFSSTILNIAISDTTGVGSDSTTLAHVFIEEVGGGGSAVGGLVGGKLLNGILSGRLA